MTPLAADNQPPVGLASIGYGYLINSVLPLWIPQTSIGRAVAAGGVVLAVLLAVPLLAAAITAVIRGTAVQRMAVVGLAAESAVVYAASVRESPNPFFLERYG